jgi:peptide/nickel transport system substrate-binding protein
VIPCQEQTFKLEISMAKSLHNVVFPAMLALMTNASVQAAPDTLVYGTTSKVTQMDPANAYEFHTWELIDNFNEGLLTYKPGTSEIIQGLADKYEVNPAGTEYTFHLRPGLKFTDGTPFTADTVKWTIDRVTALKGDPSWLVTQFVKSVDVVDASTVKFTLKGPTAFFPSILAGNPPYYPLSPNVYPLDKFISNPGELKGGQMVGLGPYKLTSFKRDEEVVFEANPSYYGAKPNIKRVILRYFANATTLRLALEKGDVDLAFNGLNPADTADMMKNPAITTHKLPGPCIGYLAFENSESVFKDRNLRKAVAALIDRPQINQKVYLGQNEPLYSMVPKGMSCHTEVFKTILGDGNLPLAEKLLKAAGYTSAKPLAFDLWHMTGSETTANLAEVLKSQLEKTPLIKVTIKNAENATYKKQFEKKQMAAFLESWYPDYVDADDYTAAFAQTQGSAGNGLFFSDQHWDDLFVREQTNKDMKVRAAVFEQVQKMWTEQVPCAPIYQENLYVFTRKNVTGVKIGPPLIFRYDNLAFK